MLFWRLSSWICEANVYCSLWICYIINTEASPSIVCKYYYSQWTSSYLAGPENSNTLEHGSRYFCLFHLCKWFVSHCQFQTNKLSKQKMLTTLLFHLNLDLTQIKYDCCACHDKPSLSHPVLRHLHIPYRWCHSSIFFNLCMHVCLCKCVGSRGWAQHVYHQHASSPQKADSSLFYHASTPIYLGIFSTHVRLFSFPSSWQLRVSRRWNSLRKRCLTVSLNVKEVR